MITNVLPPFLWFTVYKKVIHFKNGPVFLAHPVYGKWSARRRDSFTVAMDMDIHGYLCVDIRLQTSTEVIGPISPNLRSLSALWK